MRATGILLSVVLMTVPLSGCIGPEETVYEGLSLEGGNAIAHNSALQIIDPWPPGVQDTDLVVPAERGGDADEESEDGAEPAL